MTLLADITILSRNLEKSFKQFLFVLPRVALLEEIAQGRFGVDSSIDIEQYDDAEQGGDQEDFYEESEFQNIQIPSKFAGV